MLIQWHTLLQPNHAVCYWSCLTFGSLNKKLPSKRHTFAFSAASARPKAVALFSESIFLQLVRLWHWASVAKGGGGSQDDKLVLMAASSALMHPQEAATCLCPPKPQLLPASSLITQQLPGLSEKSPSGHSCLFLGMPAGSVYLSCRWNVCQGLTPHLDFSTTEAQSQKATFIISSDLALIICHADCRTYFSLQSLPLCSMDCPLPLFITRGI